MDKRLEIFKRRGGVLRDLVDQSGHRVVLVADELLGEGELDPQCNQMLLASVMQIAFDAAAFLVGDLRQARPRVAQLASMGA